jgi:uncharacterized protein (DUF885 family)
MAQPPDLETRTEIREFREQNARVLNALREDLNDLRSHVDDGFVEMRGKLDATAAGLQQITTMLTTLITLDGGEDDSQ